MSELLNGWRDISEFKPEEHGNADFLVWVPVPDTGPDGASGAPFIAQWGGMKVASPEGEAVDLGETFVGEWRAVDEFKNLEPVAFKEVDLPHAQRKAEADLHRVA